MYDEWMTTLMTGVECRQCNIDGSVTHWLCWLYNRYILFLYIRIYFTVVHSGSHCQSVCCLICATATVKWLRVAVVYMKDWLIDWASMI